MYRSWPDLTSTWPLVWRYVPVLHSYPLSYYNQLFDTGAVWYVNLVCFETGLNTMVFDSSLMGGTIKNLSMPTAHAAILSSVKVKRHQDPTTASRHSRRRCRGRMLPSGTSPTCRGPRGCRIRIRTNLRGKGKGGERIGAKYLTD